MEAQEYLDQISASSKPSTSGSGILQSKFFKIGIIGAIALILIIILGAILGGGNDKGTEKSKGIELLLHLQGTAEVIESYQPKVKSSSLRSDLASLRGILSSTSQSLDDYLTQKYNLKSKDITKKTQAAADADQEALDNELFEAKINGLLDRTIAHKMVYEISLLMSEEASLYKITKNETLTSLLDESYDSLENLYNNFNKFTEGS